MEEDYYKLLGVSRNASEAEIQKAYRKMASKYHPDLVDEDDDKQRAKERFQQVQKAYDVLSDSEKRELYDRYGSSFESLGAGGGPAGWQVYQGGGQPFEEFDFFGGRTQGQGRAQGQGEADASPFEDLFRQFSRGGSKTRSRRSRSTAARGADITHELLVPFKTAVEGGEARLSVRRPSGKTDSISVKIPTGIEDGKKIRLRGQGEPSPNGGSPGDILIVVRIDTHPSFRRSGNDLIVKVPVTIGEAALGAKVDVPSPRGTISLTIPPGTSSGSRLRVKGMGVKPSKGSVGDLYAEALIVLPDELDEESRQWLKQLSDKGSQNPRSNLSW